MRRVVFQQKWAGNWHRNMSTRPFFLSFFENFCNISDLITYNCTLKCFLLIIVNLNIEYGKVGIITENACKR